MITFEMIKPIGAIAKKINFKALIPEIRAIDVEKDNANEELGILIISTIIEHLEEIADPIIELCAKFKNVTIEEMQKMNPIEILKELFSAAGFLDFFSHALAMGAKK